MLGPLDGYRILELTSTVSGPYAGMVLADQGADVIKVEPPGIGDLGRFMGSIRNGMAGMFSVLNKNKRFLALDLKDKDDLDIFFKLVETADVLIENYRPGVVKKIGIDYENLKKYNHELIYLSLTGYGQTGPYKNRRVYDPLIQATVGSAAAQNEKKPEFFRSVIFDKVSGLTSAQAITAALLEKEKTGKGQYISISMLDSALYYLWPDVWWSRIWLEEGSIHAGELADYFPIFNAKDKPIIIALVADPHFEALCLLIDNNLHEDPKFSTFAQRLVNQEELVEVINSYLIKIDSDTLCKEFDKLGIPVAAVNQLDEVHLDEQIIFQGSLVEPSHPIAGKMRLPRPPADFGVEGVFPKRHAMELGHHCREILSEINIENIHIARLEQREEAAKKTMQDFQLSQVDKNE